MATEITVTDEMRQAVYEADCEAIGHLFHDGDLYQTVQVAPELRRGGNPFKKILGSHEAGKLPSIGCTRCGRVWLLVEQPGTSYDDAVAKLQARMTDPASLLPAPPPPAPEPGPVFGDHGHGHEGAPAAPAAQ